MTETGPVKPWLRSRIERHHEFWKDETPGRFLVTLALWEMRIDYARHGFKGRPLNSWSFPDDAEAFIDLQTRRVAIDAQVLQEADDDRIPCLSPGIGIAIHSAWFSDSEVIIGKDTSWTHPVIDSWDKLETLRMDENNRWLRMISRMNRRLVERNEGDFATQTFSHLGPMDMANALRGNALFTDVFETPDEVHALMDKCAGAILWLEVEQRRIVPPVQGGTPIWGVWHPGNAVFMSEDATDLATPDIYAEFGRPYADRVSAAAGGCYIHHHAYGLRCHEAIARVAGLRVLQISQDPNCPPPIDSLGRLMEWNRGVPLMINCTPRQVYENINALKRGRVIINLQARDPAEARETVRWIRAQSR